MKKFRHLLRSILPVVCASALGISEAIALPVAAPQLENPIVHVAADCYSIGQQVAAQAGGTLAKASEANRGGQSVCVIVVLIPGKDGQRPRRTEIVVPQG
jgi:hypothetical protein